MKPRQPMMSAAQAARALGSKVYKKLVEVGEIHPTTDERGVARVPIEEVDRCLAVQALGLASPGRSATVLIFPRANLAEIKACLSITAGKSRAIEERLADPRVEFLVVLLTPGTKGRTCFRMLAASRTGLGGAVNAARDAARDEGLEPMVILDSGSEAFTILTPLLLVESDTKPLTTLIVPSLDAFTRQIEEARAARKTKEQDK